MSHDDQTFDPMNPDHTPPPGQGQPDIQSQSPSTYEHPPMGYANPTAASAPQATAAFPASGQAYPSYENQPAQYQPGPASGQYPQAGSAPSGQYPPMAGGAGQYPYPAQGQYYPPAPKKGRMTAMIIIISILVVALVGLGIWWWMARGGGSNAKGADTASASVNNLVVAVNESDFSGMLDTISPAEKQYASALGSLAIRYSIAEISDQSQSGEELYRELEERSEEIKDSVDVNLDLTYGDEVALHETMVAVPVTGGRMSVEVHDREKLATALSDAIWEAIPEDVRAEYDVDMPASKEELREEILSSLPEGPETSEITGGEFAFISVREDTGWFISPVSSMVTAVNADYFFDPAARATFIDSYGTMPVLDLEGADAPDAAAESFVDEINAGNLAEIVRHLPLAEARPLSLALYLGSESTDGMTSFQGLITLNDVSFHTIPVSDHAAVAKFDSLTIDVSPMLAGGQMSIGWDNGTLTAPFCQTPVDLSFFASDERPIVALGVIKDESGWNVSLGATGMNIVGVLAGLPEDPDVLNSALSGLLMCDGM